MRPIDVGIIGAGTAGSAAAIFLARAGHRVTLYERVPDPRPVGAGITIQPTGLHVLGRLGLREAIVSRGARIDRLMCESTSRRRLVDLWYRTVDERLFGVGLHRGVLFEALFGAVQRETIVLRSGIEIVGRARGAGAVRASEERPSFSQAAHVAHAAHAKLTRSSWLVDAHGERHGPHELVIVADGARSTFRERAGSGTRVTPYPWGALWFVGRETREPSSAEARVLHQIVDGNQRFLGILPTGRAPESTGEECLVSLFWSIRRDRVDAWRARGLGPWKAELEALAPESAPILAQIDDIDEVLFAAYHDVVMHRWSTRDVVYIGDAAHATSPQLGQGCNLALWDAMVLADVLAREPSDLARALDAYSRARADHLAFYQLATRLLTPFFQGDDTVLGVLRDIGMPIMGKIPITNRIMTLSMLGIVDGFMGDVLPLDMPLRRER